jgi:glutaredoxin-related protein
MAKVFAFGSQLGPDGVAMQELLDVHLVRCSCTDMLESIGTLKPFLRYQGALPGFDSTRLKGSVGLPFVLVNNGEWASLDPPSRSPIARLKE